MVINAFWKARAPTNGKEHAAQGLQGQVKNLQMLMRGAAGFGEAGQRRRARESLDYDEKDANFGKYDDGLEIREHDRISSASLDLQIL